MGHRRNKYAIILSAIRKKGGDTFRTGGGRNSPPYKRGDYLLAWVDGWDAAAARERYYQQGLTDTVQNRPSLAMTLWIAEERDLCDAYVDGEQAALELLDP